MTVECPTATRLLQSYVRAATTCANASSKLDVLTSKREEFGETLERLVLSREERDIFRLAIENHWREHNCQRWEIANFV